MPICIFDAKKGSLCPQCESKLVSGKKTPRFFIDTDKVISTAKNLGRIDFSVEFEVRH